MLPSVFILEYSGALVAIKFCIVKLVKGKSIDVFCEAQGLSAVGARVVSALPLSDTGTAAKLATFETLFWLFHHLQANGAGKVAINIAINGHFRL